MKKTNAHKAEFGQEAGEIEIPSTYVVISGNIQPDNVAKLFERSRQVDDGVLYRFGLHFRECKYKTSGANIPDF